MLFFFCFCFQIIALSFLLVEVTFKIDFEQAAWLQKDVLEGKS